MQVFLSENLSSSLQVKNIFFPLEKVVFLQKQHFFYHETYFFLYKIAS